MINFKVLLCVLTLMPIINGNAQTYLISFTGSGASNSVSTVKVENLTASTSLILNQDQVLRLSISTGVNLLEKYQTPGLKIFPNPMADYSTIQIYPPDEGNAFFEITEITGKMLANVKNYLENSLQEFRLSGLNSGFYLVSVKGNTFRYSGKLLSNNNLNGVIRIEKINDSKAFYDKTIITKHKGEPSYIDMGYNTGDLLKFTGVSGIYSTVKTDIPSGDKTISFNFISCTDGDNNNYPVVEIGTQVWMEENLRTTKYRNGESIGTTNPATFDISNEPIPKYQWAYDGSESNVAMYGRLYTWYSVTDLRNVCPAGWHIPNAAEWTNLTDYLTNNGYGYQGSGSDIAKSMAATWVWSVSGIPGLVGNNQNNNNRTGFTAFPAGHRHYSGFFDGKGTHAYWWSSTENNSEKAWNWMMNYNGSDIGQGSNIKYNGFSIRCVKDQ